MAAWVCRSCTAVYSVGAPRCPQCGADDYVEQGAENMPKITKHGGVSDATDPGTFAESGGLAESGVEVDEGQATVDEYDPTDYTVGEVNTYLDQCASEGNQTEYDRVLLAERTDQGGKGRAGILGRVI